MTSTRIVTAPCKSFTPSLVTDCTCREPFEAHSGDSKFHATWRQGWRARIMAKPDESECE